MSSPQQFTTGDDAAAKAIHQRDSRDDLDLGSTSIIPSSSWSDDQRALVSSLDRPLRQRAEYHTQPIPLDLPQGSLMPLPFVLEDTNPFRAQASQYYNHLAPFEEPYDGSLTLPLDPSLALFQKPEQEFSGDWADLQAYPLGENGQPVVPKGAKEHINPSPIRPRPATVTVSRPVTTPAPSPVRASTRSKKPTTKAIQANSNAEALHGKTNASPARKRYAANTPKSDKKVTSDSSASSPARPTTRSSGIRNK